MIVSAVGGYVPWVMTLYKVGCFLMRIKAMLLAPKPLACGCSLSVRIIPVNANPGVSA